MGGTVWSIHILGKNGLEIAHLSAAAFEVGRRSRFDCRLLTPALSAWRSTFRRLLEGVSASVPPFFLGLRRPSRFISGLALRDAGANCWRSWGGLVGVGAGSWLSSAAPGEPGASRWSSSAAPGEPGAICWSSPAALCVPGNDGWCSLVKFCSWRQESFSKAQYDGLDCLPLR